MDAVSGSRKLTQDEFDRKIVLLLTANVDQHCEDGDVLWEKMAKKMREFSKRKVPWRDLKLYYECHILLKLRNFINDQQMIDRLQYPYLEKIYKIRVIYQSFGPKLAANSSIVARNNRLIKYSVDDRYDAEVVNIFKRLHNVALLDKIRINVKDPVYGLLPVVQEFLLKPLRLRKCEPLRRRFSSKFGTVPVHMHRHVAMKKSSPHRACVEAFTSAFSFVDLSMRIEDVSSANPSRTEFARRDLMETEYLTIPTQEFRRRQQLVHSEVDGETGTNSAERNKTPCNHEAGSSDDAEVRECVSLYDFIADDIFVSTDDDEEEINNGNGGPSPNPPEVNVEDTSDVCQIVCTAPAGETVSVRTGDENIPELPCSERLVCVSQDPNSRISSNNMALQKEIVQPNESAPTLLGMDTEPVGLANCPTELVEATLLPVTSIGRIPDERIAQSESKLGRMLTAKTKVYQTLRIMAPKLFFRFFATDGCLTLSNRLAIMQLLATSMNVVHGQPMHLLPILCRIECGDFHDIRCNAS